MPHSAPLYFSSLLRLAPSRPRWTPPRHHSIRRPRPELTLEIEPGIAAALSDPQAERTAGGFAQTVKVLFGLNRYLSVGPTASFTRVWGFSPWLDADLPAFRGVCAGAPLAMSSS